jgi:hypothetical protein
MGLSRLNSDATVEAAAGELVPGTSLSCRWAVIPADLRLDQSMLTGDLIASEAGQGKIVFAGALARREEGKGDRNPQLFRPPRWCVSHRSKARTAGAVLGIVRNLTIVNFAVVVATVAYAHAIAMTVPQAIPLVLTALLCTACDFHAGCDVGRQGTRAQGGVADPTFGIA